MMIDVNGSLGPLSTCTAGSLTISSADLSNISDRTSYSISSAINREDMPCKNYEPVKESPEERKAREELERSIRKYTPKRIVYNNPATIVFWKDGTKTVVKCAEGETYSEYFGFLAALGKKIFGTNSEINRIVKTHIPKVKEVKPKTYPKPEEKPVTFRDTKGRYAKAEKKPKKKEQKKK